MRQRAGRRVPDCPTIGFMKTAAALQPLIDDGVIDEVIRSLKSGKEATVYLVRSGVHTRCAKVYRGSAHPVTFDVTQSTGAVPRQSVLFLDQWIHEPLRIRILNLEGWRSFLCHLKDRGLKGVRLIISDAQRGSRRKRAWRSRLSTCGCRVSRTATAAPSRSVAGGAGSTLPSRVRRVVIGANSSQGDDSSGWLDLVQIPALGTHVDRVERVGMVY
jgi:Transposase, Mutator family